jgi:hypothetical protein
MTDRVLDFSQAAADLSIRNGLLVVRQGNAELDAIPCEEIAALICSHRQVSSRKPCWAGSRKPERYS